MRTQHHPLSPSSSGTQRELLSLHFGQAGARPKVYIQTGLHADELPGMMVVHHLRQRLEALDAEGAITGEIVLVPLANPIGLNQHLMYAHLGRFELNTGENFNRHYPDFAAELIDTLSPQLGPDAEHNQHLIRQALGQWLMAQQPKTELQALRLQLLRLAFDADVVLDLHCDFEAAMHIYIEEPYVHRDDAQALARYLGAETVLYAQGSGSGQCFDECLSGLWWRLAQRLSADTPIPLACLTSTIELRGQTDVGGQWARQDAQQLAHYLCHLGVISGQAPEPPAARCAPTPLAGVQTLRAPHAGVIDYHLAPGTPVRVGEVIATVVEPLSNRASAVCAEIDGHFFQRQIQRWATPDMDLGKIAGAIAFKTGELLTP